PVSACLPARRSSDLGGGPAVGSGEVAGERVRIDSGGGDDDLEVRPTRKYLPQVSEQEVDVEAAFVRLVDDDRVVGAEEPVPSDLGEQQAVRHDLDGGVRSGAVVKADGG